jgi:tetratricopeptide (TPR) repeat protein
VLGQAEKTPSTNGTINNSVAWLRALGHAADPSVPLRLAEAALAAAPKGSESSVLKTLGAALYRAGRYEEAIHQMEEGIRVRRGISEPQDWTFLALAHRRLGHHAEARRWLDRFQTYRPSADPDQLWNELEIRLLRSEAESVVLFDPVFPADPFAAN